MSFAKTQHEVSKTQVPVHQKAESTNSTQEIKPALHPKTRKQMKDEDGNFLFVFNANASNRALELIGKHVDIGAFKDKDRLEISGGISLVERLQAGRDRVRRTRVEDAEAP